MGVSAADLQWVSTIPKNAMEQTHLLSDQAQFNRQKVKEGICINRLRTLPVCYLVTKKHRIKTIVVRTQYSSLFP